ncbi:MULTISPECIES: hypothetical protein [Aeromonas]|uniref:hypothetical protein n=1 Tax=Aeromonas TaxID=642 RepID=UPI00191EE225|nr:MULTISPECIES: hypothetical protein [Aeromonas]MBL0451337.1 hypothetical protein [Aeromonas caviae]UBO74382.1 hypothetical protein KYK33_01890 [Aeromonas rivuli]
MAESKKKRKKTAKIVDGAMLNNATYAVKGAGNSKPSKNMVMKINAKECSTTKKAIEAGKKMATIEAYAKEHKITVTQAMIYFMN